MSKNCIPIPKIIFLHKCSVNIYNKIETIERLISSMNLIKIILFSRLSHYSNSKIEVIKYFIQ